MHVCPPPVSSSCLALNPGVKFAAAKAGAGSKLRRGILVAAPFLYLSCVAWLVHRMQNPHDSVGRKV